MTIKPMHTSRVLPILDENRELIERPDLFTLARLSIPESEGEELVTQVWRHMTLNSDNSAPLSDFDQVVEAKYLRRKRFWTERRHAAMIIVELMRLRFEGLPLTRANAYRLVAKALRDEGGRQDELSMTTVLQAEFKRWVNTAHLEAALRWSTPGPEEFENDAAAFTVFLSNARSFEQEIDVIADKSGFEWNPWRIPDCFAPSPLPGLYSLTEDERAFVI
ncbi:hypothetical protein [Salipiger bermudensis]|uniref:hypothetical protein n=1 Tax=Salipiger bermudensis TaxID=344736 RepID=UPI00300A25F1